MAASIGERSGIAETYAAMTHPAPHLGTYAIVRAAIVSLIGVYDADHTLRGELAYVIGRRLGRRHCALCDITHGAIRQRDDWKACRASLPVPFVTFHRDDQPAEVRAAAFGRVPAVVAETNEGIQMLLGPAAIEECAGDPQRLIEAIENAVAAADLDWFNMQAARLPS